MIHIFIYYLTRHDKLANFNITILKVWQLLWLAQNPIIILA